MIQRRHFIGSVAAFCTFAGAASRIYASPLLVRPSDRPLNWQCDIIRTVPHDNRTRAPIVTGVSIQPDGNQLAVVGDDHYVCIFDTAVKKFVAHLGDHTDWVRTTKYSPNGKRLASAGNDRKLRIWDTANYQARPKLHLQSNAVICVDFASDSNRLATVGFGPELRMYDLDANRVVRRLQCECPDNHAVAFSRDDALIAAGGRSGKIRVWNVETGELVNQFKPHRQRIRSIEFSASNEIISCSDDQTVQISNLKNPAQSKSLPRHAAKLYDIALLTKDLLATSGSDNLIHIWHLGSSRQIGTLNGHTGTVSCLDFCGSKIASGGYDTEVRVWKFQEDFDPAVRQTRRIDRQQQRSIN